MKERLRVRLKARLSKLLQCQKGLTNITSFVLISWIVILVATAGLDVFFMMMQFTRVNSTTQAALDMMKDEGYFSREGEMAEGASIEEWFTQELEGLQVGHEDNGANDVVILGYTNDHIDNPDDRRVNRGERLHLHVGTRYEIRSFQPLGLLSSGQDVDGVTFNVPWDVKKTGVSRVFVRTLREL